MKMNPCNKIKNVSEYRQLIETEGQAFIQQQLEIEQQNTKITIEVHTATLLSLIDNECMINAKKGINQFFFEASINHDWICSLNFEFGYPNYREQFVHYSKKVECPDGSVKEVGAIIIDNVLANLEQAGLNGRSQGYSWAIKDSGSLYISTIIVM